MGYGNEIPTFRDSKILEMCHVDGDDRDDLMGSDMLSETVSDYVDEPTVHEAAAGNVGWWRSSAFNRIKRATGSWYHGSGMKKERSVPIPEKRRSMPSFSLRFPSLLPWRQQ